MHGLEMSSKPIDRLNECNTRLRDEVGHIGDVEGDVVDNEVACEAEGLMAFQIRFLLWNSHSGSARRLLDWCTSAPNTNCPPR